MSIGCRLWVSRHFEEALELWQEEHTVLVHIQGIEEALGCFSEVDSLTSPRLALLKATC